ncbi:MAG: endopeptidase La [Oligoflexia bacterium]|nr:endopeptidase La [Oligoflexia bacterium]
MPNSLESEIEIQVGADTGGISETLKSIAVIPIMSSPIFPGMIAPIVLTEDKFVSELEQCISKNNHVGLNLMKVRGRKKGPYSRKTLFYSQEDGVSSEDRDEYDDRDDDGNKNTHVNVKTNTNGTESKGNNTNSNNDIYQVGVICKVVKKLRLPDGSVNLLVHGLRRYRIEKSVDHSSYIMAVPLVYEDELEADSELDAYTRSVINQVKKLSELNPYFNEEMKLAMLNSPSPGALADLVAFALSLDVPEAQDFLETVVVKKRFAKLLVYLKREKDVADIQKKIADEVNDKVNKYQKEYFLREQLKVIRQELGMEEDEKSKDIKKLREAIEKADPPNEIKKIVFEELDKLESIHDSSPEYNVIRTYVGWISQLPWNKSTNDAVDINNAETILNRDHYGLEKAKQRVLEFLAVRKLRPQYDGTILCFAGPPGVGKTSLGKSIAHSLGREFYRFSLGGMRDEAEIKGHRRTYVGAMPGKLIQALKRVEVNNPVIMLDEIDKMGQSFQGDPASALLEVLDPEQNSRFIDNYLDVSFDLSKVLFIATANHITEIPEPLLDRMEVIELSGYTVEEKVPMARRWIIPKQLKKHGLNNKDISFSVSLIKKIIADYAREPGVRSMEQCIARICRSVALSKVQKKQGHIAPKISDLEQILGVSRFNLEMAEALLDPGVVIGLAWTPFGGDILKIECIPLKGKGFKLTGQLGEVMSESANLAYSYVKRLLQEEMDSFPLVVAREKQATGKKVVENEKNKEKVVLPTPVKMDRPDDDVAKDFLSTHEIHLHLPAGAIPKDGPSAGISMALALYGLSHNVRVKSGIAMTGELSLTGKVLPIGGLKEKVLAAKRAGISNVVFPEQNKKDLKEVPERHRKGLNFIPVTHFREVLDFSLERKNGKFVQAKGSRGKGGKGP